jgi:hypothetical protein
MTSLQFRQGPGRRVFRRFARGFALIALIVGIQVAIRPDGGVADANGPEITAQSPAATPHSIVTTPPNPSQSIFGGHTYPVPSDFVLQPAPANAVATYPRDQVILDVANSLRGVGRIESVDLGYVAAPQMPDTSNRATQLEWIVAITGVSSRREVPPGSRCYGTTPPSGCTPSPTLPVTRFLFFNATTGYMDMGENYSP